MSLSSPDLKLTTTDSAADMAEPQEVARERSSNRLGPIWIVSLVLHVVAGIALLRSWDVQSRVVEPEPVAVVTKEPAIESVPVMRLELAVAPASESEIVKAAARKADRKKIQDAGDEGPGTLELNPATGKGEETKTPRKTKFDEMSVKSGIS
jgi:hypothetical protein